MVDFNFKMYLTPKAVKDFERVLKQLNEDQVNQLLGTYVRRWTQEKPQREFFFLRCAEIKIAGMLLSLALVILSLVISVQMLFDGSIQQFWSSIGIVIALMVASAVISFIITVYDWQIYKYVILPFMRHVYMEFVFRKVHKPNAWVEPVKTSTVGEGVLLDLIDKCATGRKRGYKDSLSIADVDFVRDISSDFVVDVMRVYCDQTNIELGV